MSRKRAAELDRRGRDANILTRIQPLEPPLFFVGREQRNWERDTNILTKDTPSGTVIILSRKGAAEVGEGY